MHLASNRETNSHLTRQASLQLTLLHSVMAKQQGSQANIWKETESTPVENPSDVYTSVYDSAIAGHPVGYIPAEDETFSGKLWQKIKREPLIPLGQNTSNEKTTNNKLREERPALLEFNHISHRSFLLIFVSLACSSLLMIGALATATAFGLGLRSMIQSNAHRQQMMMRARVGAQAFTILAFIGYSFTNINPQTGMTRMQSEAMERQKKRELAQDMATR